MKLSDISGFYENSLKKKHATCCTGNKGHCICGSEEHNACHDQFAELDLEIDEEALAKAMYIEDYKNDGFEYSTPWEELPNTYTKNLIRKKAKSISSKAGKILRVKK